MICAETADQQILRDCCLLIVRPLIRLLHLSPVGRRSRPFQRGAAECQVWNEHVYLATIIWLRLRRAERSPGHDPSGRLSLCLTAGFSGLRPRAERKRERAQMPWLGWRGGWGQKGGKGGRDKQGDPPGPERCSWPKCPKSRPAGVRASIVARNRGNARGAKGRREVEA